MNNNTTNENWGHYGDLETEKARRASLAKFYKEEDERRAKEKAQAEAEWEQAKANGEVRPVADVADILG